MTVFALLLSLYLSGNRVAYSNSKLFKTIKLILVYP